MKAEAAGLTSGAISYTQHPLNIGEAKKMILVSRLAAGGNKVVHIPAPLATWRNKYRMEFFGNIVKENTAWVHVVSIPYPTSARTAKPFSVMRLLISRSLPLP